MFYRPRVSLSEGSPLYGSGSVVGHTFLYLYHLVATREPIQLVLISNNIAISWLIMSVASEKVTSQVRCRGNLEKDICPLNVKADNMWHSVVLMWIAHVHGPTSLSPKLTVVANLWPMGLPRDACQPGPRGRGCPTSRDSASYLGFFFSSVTPLFIAIVVFCFQCQVQRLLGVGPQGVWNVG